ncbi:hypothetical protein ED733_001396 [Metarhizium rileyi]|uniref:Amidase domain-containing protein n=1 Tax=Metarhizium rileyi (strain RCEF 4871) TaxID=1649241 RepID=A0A5C6FZE7_METRR|nr:hypothetical protein ED733_001396 [Metarhizium rileyi]
MVRSNVFIVSLGLAGSLLTPGALATHVLGVDFPSLLDATLDDLRQGLDSGLFTSVDLTKAYIARINEVANELHAVNEVNPDALSIAAAMDAERRKNSTHSRGPLHGIPVLLKDNMATLDRMITTAGSFALVGAQPEEDSTVAAKLRKAGVILLGKTNMSEWANCRSVNTTHGWSAYGGQTKGAYLRDQDPSGSSSGSAVSSSIGLAWAALGTETIGSIISPANVNNIVGIKPSVGLTSRYMVVPISEHQDTVGPMARTVKDAAYLLAAIAGVDKNDNYTSAIPFKGNLPDYVAACKEGGLKGKRFGVPRSWLAPQNETTPALLQAFEDSLKLLQSEGAVIVDNIKTPGLKKIRDSFLVVMGADMLTGFSTHYLNHLKTNPNNITTLRKMKDFTENSPKEEWPVRDTLIWQNALDRGINNTSPQFWGNLTEQLDLAGPLGILGAIKNNSLDALVIPTTFLHPLSAFAGGPVITVPMGKEPDTSPEDRDQPGGLIATGPNLPFGLAFAGEPFGEEKLIEIAYAFEQKTKARGTVQPLVKPKTELRDMVGRQKNRFWCSSGRRMLHA